MNLSVHFVVSAVLTVMGWPFLGWYSLWIMVGGFCIDVDHYFYYVYQFKKMSLKQAYEHYFHKQWKGSNEFHLHVFHTIEFWIFMVLLGVITRQYLFLWYMFMITFIGMGIHIMLDFINLFRFKLFGIRAVSIVEWVQRKEK